MKIIEKRGNVMRNIALIGMMGSGKTTLGKLLAERLGLDYICADDYLEQKHLRSISDIFEKDGEETFRKMEIEVTKELSKKRNIVLATGGGIVLNKVNIDELRENGFIILFLNRSVRKILEDITTDNRPLLKDDVKKLEDIYSKREFLYKKYSDIIINNDEDLDESLEKVYNVLAFITKVEFDKDENRRIVYY
jgi:shikimate kinase